MVHNLKIDEIPTSVSRLRSITAQVVACMCPYILLLDLGMTIGFATIALPELLHSTHGLTLNDEQASWFGSLSYLTQPMGAVLSGPVVDYFGRKKANFLVNIPHLVAWVLMYFAWNLPSLFVANALLGLGTGIMEAPINSYVGEVTEPSIRGVLCTVTQMFAAMGLFAMYFLGSVVEWRLAALICVAAPISAMLLVLLVPETPIWLLSRGREKEALKSLCYLRGWTSPENVKEEFDQLSNYSKSLQSCFICYKTDNQDAKDCVHVNINWFKRFFLKLRYLILGKETLRPFILVIMYFTFYTMSGLSPVRPNMVNVCQAFGMADDGKHIVLMVGLITLVTSIINVGFIKILGKRKLAISSLLMTALSCMCLSIYAKNNLDQTVFSYDPTTFPKETSYVPLVFFYSMTIFTGFGVPWILLGEVFPFRSRALAQGIAAAGSYVIMFIGSKTFINLESSIELWGTFAFYSAMGFLGGIYLYFFLPETEGNSLEEIESYYNGKFRIFADDSFINFFKRFKKKV